MKLYHLEADNAKYWAIAHFAIHETVGKQCPQCKKRDVQFFPGSCSAFVTNPQKKWPDILCSLCLGWGSLVVSDQVKTDMENAAIRGMEFFPFELKRIPDTKKPLQHYWLLVPHGKGTVDYLAPNEIKEKWTCPQCGRFLCSNLLRSEGIQYPFRLTLFSEENDFYLIEDSYNTYFTLCSERVIDLAREKKWTNCQFSPYKNDKLGPIRIHHESSNWREILERDIARREAIARGEVVPEEPKPVEQKPKKRKKPIQSNHPFDNLSTFDGTAWQGSTTWVCGFGSCEFVVYPDEDAEAVEDDEGEVWPTHNQRKLFDFFTQQDAEIAKQLQPLLVDFLRNEGVSFPDGTMAFSKLAEWVEIGDFEIRNAKRGGGGIVRLAYLLKSNQESIVFHVRCVPSKKTYKIQGEN